MPPHENVTIYGNRGASGIDGTVATALGAGCDLLIIGDVALYHDLNSLHLIRRAGIPLIIVCINNDGGGIFHRLPIAEHDPPFTERFITPHGLTFEHAAQMFGIPYTQAEAGDSFRGAYQAALASGDAHLIEVLTDAAAFERQRRALSDEVQRRIKAAGLLD
jgi:2-succinyl-5-enolpyruvyl-6-hydroxy-3-cyclohexene-1-carboxylate synthase